VFPNQIQGLVLAQKRPAVPAEAKHGVGAVMTACWAHKPTKRPAMADVINDLLHAAFQYLWDTNGRGTLTAGTLSRRRMQARSSHCSSFCHSY